MVLPVRSITGTTGQFHGVNQPNAIQALTIYDTAVSESEVKTTEGKKQTGENSKRPGVKIVGTVPAKFSATPLAKRSLGKQS